MLSERTRAWFARTLGEPTEVQRRGWEAIERGGHVLLHAPTGSGKTLAAFLHAIDRLAASPGRGLRVLYVSPLKALAADVEKNLEAPLRGIGAPLTVALRTGDTPARARRQFVKTPADILVTTPESLYLLLTSRAREALTRVETVIVDEVHALAGSKRGAHLALSLERLDARLERRAQRVGLTATAHPLEEVARFLGGAAPVAVVSAKAPRPLEVLVEEPKVELVGPLLELVSSHRSTIVFANSRMTAERLASQLNDRAGHEIARAHHGSVAPAQRSEIEGALKAGNLEAVVATSSLELGIDMGAVDLVVQVNAPSSVSSGLQRIGRAGHSVGGVSAGRIFPRGRTDLLVAAVVAREMKRGAVESTTVPRNPLDVLAQQVVAMTAMDPWRREDLLACVRRAAPYASLAESAFDGLLDMLLGRYPSADFAELRPRLVREGDKLEAHPFAWRLAIANAGTIPDRGLYAVHPLGGGPRLGELDEEQVAELQPGDVFVLGSSSWRVAETSRDRVWVEPAPGETGKLPFWRGDAPSRPVELGRAIARFMKEPDWDGLSEPAAHALSSLLDEARSALGTLPGEDTLVLERFEDALGESLACLLSPLGGRLHEPWALAIEAKLHELGRERVRALASDDGIVIRAPGVPSHELLAAIRLGADEARELVLRSLGESTLFETRFRDAAARALLLPRRLPGKRTPLWLQRLRARDLLAAAARFPEFPITIEAFRDCLEDAFDLRALSAVLDGLERGTVQLVEATTAVPSPFAASLASEGALAFLEQATAPRAERRAQALALDRGLLREVLGQDEIRELVSPEVLAEIEAELAARAQGVTYEAKDARDRVLLYARAHGPFTEDALRDALGADPREALRGLEREGLLVRGGFRPGGHGLEWIERDVLARLRRRSLAALRAAIEPAPPELLGRFLPAWQGVPGRRRGASGVLESVKQLEGCPLPARILESDVLPARVRDYQPWMLDELATSGEIAWRGHGEGRVLLLRRDQLARIPRAPLEATHALAPVLRERLAKKGACFFLDLIVSESFEPVLEALWDLLWAGEVVADSFLPLRGYLEKHKGSKHARRVATRVPAPAQGRFELAPAPTGDERLLAHAACERLLDRHGVLTREAALAEEVPGGWAGLYPVLALLEGAGRVRRGNFVRGVEGAQFALPGAVDRLRAAPAGAALVLAAADPASPYGAALPGPVARKPGARVVLVDGVLVLAHSARALTTHAADEALLLRAVRALAEAVTAGRLRRVEVVTVDGSPVLGSPREALLRGAGFVSTARGLTLER
jgi:ATP-dependent Lhr-like helicase